MRVICGDYATEIKWAERNGKQLVLKDFDNVCYYTDDYYHENIALCALNDLVVNGYIRVNVLHTKEESNNDKDDVAEGLYIKLMNTYIRETADSDGQLFCGCRREDCMDYMCYPECRKCLEHYLKEDF